MMNATETGIFSIEPERQLSGPNIPEHMYIWGPTMPYGPEFWSLPFMKPELTCTSSFTEAGIGSF